MFMFHDHNRGSVAKFSHIPVATTNQNYVHEDVGSRLYLVTTCYYLLQNNLSSQLLCKYFKIITQKTVISPAVLKGKNMEDLSIDGRIILRHILKEMKCENVAWIQFIQIGRLL
jgi:hypothetical protein